LHIYIYVFVNMYTCLTLYSQQSVTNAYNTGRYVTSVVCRKLPSHADQ